MPFNATTGGGGGTTDTLTSADSLSNDLGYRIFRSTNPSLTNNQLYPERCDNAGIDLVNPGIYNAAITQTSVSVAVTSTQIVAANDNRTGIIIQNQDASNPIWLALDGAAATADGLCLKLAAGASYFAENNLIPNQAIFGIATGGTVVAHVSEAS